LFEQKPILTVLGSYRTGLFDRSAGEIPAYDSQSQRLFVVHAAGRAVDVLDMRNPAKPTRIKMRMWTIWGMYPPGAIAPYVTADGNRYLVTANEGHSSDWSGYSEVARVISNNVRLNLTL
jgi:hypothetical protein